MKRFVITGAMLLMMGLAVPSFAARQDQKEEPHPAPPAHQDHPQPAHQEHQQPAHQAHPPQAAHPERPAGQPPQHQQAPQPSRPERQAPAQAPPQAQPQHQAPAQAEHHEHRGPQQQHPPAHPPQGATQPTPQQAPPPRTYNGSQHGGTHNNPQQQHNNPQQQHNYHGAQQNPQQVRSEFQHSHAHSWQSQHRTWGQRGGYHGYRIPTQRFGVYFGRPHPFRIWGLPLQFVSGYPSFQYDGYWVTLVDPWPEFWPSDWYQTDDVYLDYTDDGYYLYDVTRGGPGIACEVAD
jgi:hypothetical protein